MRIWGNIYTTVSPHRLPTSQTFWDNPEDLLQVLLQSLRLDHNHMYPWHCRLKHRSHYFSPPVQHSRCFSHHEISNTYNFDQFHASVNAISIHLRQPDPHNNNPSKDISFYSGLQRVQQQT